MNEIKQAARSARKFVEKHKVGIAVVATSAFWIAANRSTSRAHNDFLREHDLYDEFYAIPE